MRRIVPLLRIALVCVTAIMVLVAGSPYIACGCPDGHRKLFCFRSPAEPDGCCLESPKPKPCCCRTNADKGEGAGPQRIAEKSGCRKILTPPTLVAVQDAPASSDHTASAPLFAPASSLDLVLSPSCPAHDSCVRLDHRTPPPVDRIIALCHFNI